MRPPRALLAVMPRAVARAVRDAPNWFVIGGQAVRFRHAYRPTDDVDFGVSRRKDLAALVRHLRSKGKVEVIEQSADTAHLIFEGSDISIFVLPKLAEHVEDRALTLRALLATKVHAIVDRGTRRDFFDLYVLLSEEHLGVVDCLGALREIYGEDVNDGLVLRALAYFDDADREARLPGEGLRDWDVVKRFFAARAAAQLVPPDRTLGIQARARRRRKRHGARR